MKNKQAIPALVLTLGLIGPAQSAQAGLNESDIQAAVKLMEQARQQTGADTQSTYAGTMGGYYVSPFSANGELSSWVRKATTPVIRRRFGPRARHVTRQPENLKERLGGLDVIRAASDVSFPTVDELATYMHGQYADHPDYAQALAVTVELYPELEHRYLTALKNAAKDQDAGAVKIAQAVVASHPSPDAASLSPGPAMKITSLAEMTAPVPADLSELTAPVELQTAQAEKEQGLQMLTQNVDLGLEPKTSLMADAETDVELTVTSVAEAEPQPKQLVDAEEPYAEEIERIMRPVRLAQAQQFEERTQLVNVEQGAETLTVEQRLEALKQRRARGEITGDEYLAERRRIIYS